MKNLLLCCVLVALNISSSFAIQLASGNIVKVANMQSKFITARDVHVWLPEHYSKSKSEGKSFAVLYMHDGQMLFDASITWNGQEWGVDEVASRLMQQGKTVDFIVVAIDNGGDKLRHAEYFPQRAFESLPEVTQQHYYQLKRNANQYLFGGNQVQSDAYLQFLVTELKPFIDSNFAVKTDRQNTLIMGSSMGGLISAYAISEYPDVFGGAACLSTHWPGEFNMENNPIPQAFYQYLQANLPDPKGHRIYFDHGTETLDSLYPPLQSEVDAIMRSKGYSQSNWMTKVFDGHAHTETDWQRRLHQPLIFLLGATK